MTTIYSELIEAAGAEFLPQAEGEPDGHYLRRLVLAVSKASDNDWEHLSKEAQDWYNAQAIRVKAQQDPEECPGFAHEPCIEEILRFTAEEQYLLLNGTPEGRARADAWRKEFGIPEPTVTGPDEVEMENRIKDAATPFVGRKIDDEMVEELTNVVRFLIEGKGVNDRLWKFSRPTAYRMVKAKMRQSHIVGGMACPKGLRHGHGVACVAVKIPLTTIQKWLGHARIETTAIYLDVLGEEERALAMRLWRAP